MQALLKQLELQAYPEPPSKGPLTLNPKTLNPLPEANAFAAVLEEHGRQDLLAKALMETLRLKRV